MYYTTIIPMLLVYKVCVYIYMSIYKRSCRISIINSMFCWDLRRLHPSLGRHCYMAQFSHQRLGRWAFAQKLFLYKSAPKMHYLHSLDLRSIFLTTPEEWDFVGRLGRAVRPLHSRTSAQRRLQLYFIELDQAHHGVCKRVGARNTP